MKNRFLVITVIFLFFSCRSEPDAVKDKNENLKTINTLTFIATGDNLFHETIINSSLKDGVYDFTPIYSEIKTIVDKADLAFVNQETVMAGASFGYSGYPAFNSPQSLAKTLADTGFDIVNQANNHSMDMGKAGLYATLDLWDTIKEVTVIGARKAGESARIITKNNISLGFLSYTYGLNGNMLPSDNPSLVSLINRNIMEKEIDALRPLCDFLIVSMHWGDEYETEPGKAQTDLAMFLAEHNVDVIIGHHPHVLQKAQTITLEDGRKTLCFYSLGNFVSNQRENERIIGGMMAVTFTKQNSAPETAELSISDYGMIPVICHFDRGFINTKVYPLFSYSEEILKNHALKNKDLTMNYFYSVLKRMETKIFMHNPF
ncbi:MAG: CapA family protein [Treponema sp.]|jgi:poly-gamma-glutamate synthesis protein (capsule biosynthesis protein)|nr:CapA family protein [Treponema sp.]